MEICKCLFGNVCLNSQVAPCGRLECLFSEEFFVTHACVLGFAVHLNSLLGLSFPPLKYHKLTIMTDRHLKILWNGRQDDFLESPGQAPPWFCDVDHVVDDTDVFNGIAIGFTSFGTSIG
ncbi:hypothetical protein TSMEX_004225 [Taenia solium]|eukprot:TsM_001242600 transcript=TsM_001242600 gene=TsM_001242600